MEVCEEQVKTIHDDLVKNVMLGKAIVISKEGKKSLHFRPPKLFANRDEAIMWIQDVLQEINNDCKLNKKWGEIGLKFRK